MRTRGLAIIAFAALVSVATHQMVRAAEAAAEPTADSLVAAAVKKAEAEKKTVLIEFGASWCVWCRNFENFVKAPDAGPIITANFVVVNLTVQEEGEDKKALENPGGERLMFTWGGARSGLPFYVFLDSKGQKIADSNGMPGGKNSGFPATPQEIDAFMSLIDKTAPRISPVDRSVLEASLKRTSKPAAH
jgi:thiol:disulfide interchange protein